MKQNDTEYYRDRAIQEQIAAQNAKCDPARERHEELAAMYRFRAAMLTTYPSYWVQVASESAVEVA